MQDGRFPQYSSIAHLPPILQIQVQRVQYDVKNKQTYKSDAHLRLREEIYLDRYVDSEEPTLLQKRKQSWRWKEEFGRLAAKKAELLQTEVILKSWFHNRKEGLLTAVLNYRRLILAFRMGWVS